MENKILQIVKDLTPFIFNDGRSVFDQYRDGLYVFGFCKENKIANIIRIPLSGQSKLTAAIDSLIQSCKEIKVHQLGFKLVGNLKMVDVAKQYLLSKGYQVAGVAEVSQPGTRLFFQSENYKIKIEAASHH